MRKLVRGVCVCVAAVAIRQAWVLAAVAVPGAPVIDAVALAADGGAIKVDGDLSDAVWAHTPVVSGFIQRAPHEGAAASHDTRVQVAFDETALYVAVSATEPDAHAVVGLLTRRDDISPSDWVSILIDSFHDRRTAFEFGVNASGVKYDRYWFNDTNSDDGWDAVWDVATRRTPTGWQAEFRVPFSQLRFRAGDTNTVGFAAMRTIAHLSETSSWPLLARSASGFVSSFGELRGVAREGPQKRLELMPFVLGQVQTSPVATGNPLATSPSPGATAGLDLKYKVAPGLTLTGTVNPDFGQVEADPAVVNLSGFETFFSERRPFFVEGSDTLSFNDLFYSRRIGRAPQRFADAPVNGYSDQPANTTILGAAKLTGKVGAFAVGALHAVSAREEARLASGPALDISRSPVEPTTNYSVARVSREFANNSRLSFMMTNTTRALPAELTFLPRSAVVGGVDADWRFHRGVYSLTGFWTGSRVHGTASAIDQLQQNFVHSFQRPDAAHLTYDPTRTSLNGDSASIGVSKISGTKTRFNVNTGFRSPGYDVNDLGFIDRSDDISQNAWFQVRNDVPSSHLRRRNINFNQWAGWNFSGDRRRLGGNINSHWGFTNNWGIGSGVTYNATAFDDRRTRGGPGALIPARASGFAYLDTDDRRLVTFNHETDWMRDEAGSYNWRLSNGVTLRASRSLSARVSMDISHNLDQNQWVTNLTDGDVTHYVFGRIDQQTVSLTTRVNYTLRPTLSVQIYASPFVSAGAYSTFKELVDGRAGSNDARYRAFAYTDNPDFRVRSFRMTNVLRWEYRPGSTLFAVWQQGRFDSAAVGDLRVGRDVGGAFGAPANNTFLVKISRWLDF